MAKKQKKEEDIPRTKEDVVMPKDKSFKNALSNLVKKDSKSPKEKPE